MKPTEWNRNLQLGRVEGLVEGEAAVEEEMGEVEAREMAAAETAMEDLETEEEGRETEAEETEVVAKAEEETGEVWLELQLPK